MNDFVWHHRTPSKLDYVNVIVLAWHEGKATVIQVGDDGQPASGSGPYLVSISTLNLGYGPRDLRAVPA